ncbi:hypothetical protein ACX0G9_28570 [Flavitalea flava]
MKNVTLMLLFLGTLSFAKAQTSAELLGKWKLVKWTQNGEDKDIPGYYKTDQVFQIFYEGDKFESVIDDKVHKGKWKLSDDNKELTIKSGLFSVKFSVDYFDNKKRVITTAQLGTLEYEKVPDAKNVNASN